jgi:hypothetical protein
MRLEVLTSVSANSAIFWNMTISTLVDRYQRFRGTCYLYLQDRRGPGKKNDT